MWHTRESDEQGMTGGNSERPVHLNVNFGLQQGTGICGGMLGTQRAPADFKYPVVEARAILPPTALLCAICKISASLSNIYLCDCFLPSFLPPAIAVMLPPLPEHPEG